LAAKLAAGFNSKNEFKADRRVMPVASRLRDAQVFLNSSFKEQFMSNEFELYCRIYILSCDKIEELLRRISFIINGNISSSTISNNLIHLILLKNVYYNQHKIQDHAGFIHYPFTAEINPNFEISEVGSVEVPNDYLRTLFVLITRLRSHGDLVVASCGFEELIETETGWNWSEDTPKHPKLN
jgi:hypothetical protein